MYLPSKHLQPPAAKPGLRPRSQSRARRRQAAFSLIEMLVVIAIIAVIAAIALPGIGSINSAATAAKSKRNAQNLASVFMSGQTAGVNFFTADDLDQTILNIVNGNTVTNGVFAGEYFGVPGMSTDEQTAAAAFLELSNGMLVYNSIE